MKLSRPIILPVALLSLILLNGCGLFGPTHEQRVIRGLQSRQQKTRLRTLSRLEDDITPAMRQPLVKVLESGINPTARALAADRLGTLGSKKSVSALRLSARRDNSWVVRRRALRALGQILGAEVADDLRRALRRDARPAVRVEAVQVAARRLDGAALTDLLLLALKDEQSVVRIAAQQKLTELTGKKIPPGHHKRWKQAVESQ